MTARKGTSCPRSLTGDGSISEEKSDIYTFSNHRRPTTITLAGTGGGVQVRAQVRAQAQARVRAQVQATLREMACLKESGSRFPLGRSALSKLTSTF